jgi:uncharacterized membrane protein YebE (DUF533 family)
MKLGNVLILAAVGVTGYFLYRKWQENQRAAAHPIDTPRITLQPINVDSSLVGRVIVR